MHGDTESVRNSEGQLELNSGSQYCKKQQTAMSACCFQHPLIVPSTGSLHSERPSPVRRHRPKLCCPYNQLPGAAALATTRGRRPSRKPRPGCAARQTPGRGKHTRCLFTAYAYGIHGFVNWGTPNRRRHCYKFAFLSGLGLPLSLDSPNYTDRFDHFVR